MIDVLLTSIPMIRRIDEYQSRFEEAGMNVVVPIMEDRQILTEAELIEFVPKYDVWIVGDDITNEKILRAGREGNLKVVIKWGVGVDNIDRISIDKLGLKFDYTPAMFGNEVADVAVGYLLALARNLYVTNSKVKSGIWYKPCGMSLQGKNAYLLGFGDIGKNIAKRLVGFGLNLYVCDPFFNLDLNGSGNNGNLDPIIENRILKVYKNINDSESLEGLSNADFLIVSCVLNDSTYHSINKGILGSCKQGIKVINTSRGPIIDESALIDSLESGKVSSVALDVFETEPLPLTSGLRKKEYDERTIFGSHNSSNTAEAVDATSNLVIDKIIHIWQDLTFLNKCSKL